MSFFDPDINPETEEATNTALVAIINMKEPVQGKSSSDLTSRFPAISEQGNLYVMVLYTYDDNTILVEPLPRRSDAEQLKAYKKILTRAQAGTPLTMHLMDNEASKAVKNLLTREFKLEYQLVPPHIHHRNAAEHAIRTFKNHFIAGLSSVDKDFSNSPLGPTTTTSGDHIKPTVSFKKKSKKYPPTKPFTEFSTTTRTHWHLLDAKV